MSLRRKRRCNPQVQHVVNAVEEEMPKTIKETVQRKKPIIQEKINQETKHIELDKAGDMLVGVQRQMSMAQTVEETMKVVDVPVVAQRQIPIVVQTIQKTTDIPQLQCIDKVIDVPVVSVAQAQQMQIAEKTAEIPLLQIVKKTVETPEVQTVRCTQTSESLGTAPFCQAAQAETVEQRQNHMVQTVQMPMETPQLQIVDVTGSQTPEETDPQDRMSDRVVQQTVKELKSKFEVGHTNKVHARNQPDKNRWRKKQDFEATQRQVPAIRSVQKMVEVPRVQYIDKKADIPVDMQRQVSTPQAGQHIDEVEDVTALTQSEVPNILDDDEDQLEQESKKRKLPMPAEAVSESHADESDFDRFEDLILPSPEGKTLFVSIASGDEAEDESDKEQEMTQSLVQGGESMLVDETDAESPGRQMVQEAHAEWAQELREVRKKFIDDVASEMTDLKNELAHVREMLGVLVRRERSAETKAGIAARRLDRMEREQHEADDDAEPLRISRRP